MFGCPHVDLTTAMGIRLGDYHKFVFCRNTLGIEECKEEKRLLQSLGVKGFLASLCVSILPLVDRCEEGMEVSERVEEGILR